MANRTKAKAKKERHEPGVYEREPGSGVWFVRYRVKGKLHRERVGSRSLAVKVYAKRKTEVAEARFFGKSQPAWDPPFAGLRADDGPVVLTGYAADYLARKCSTRRDLDGARRYARYFAEAPETKGKSMRSLTTQDFERYRERRRKESPPGAKRRRGAAAASTVNKELSFTRAVFYDFAEALEDRKLAGIPNPVRTRLFAAEEAKRTRWLADDEETRLRAAVGEVEWPKVLAALLTGVDRGALFGLRWADVDLRTRMIHAERRKGRRSGPVPVTVPINTELLATLRALPSRGRGEWVFPNPAGTGPLNGREFDRLVFRPALKRARVRGLRWKDLRHTFATRLRMGGADTGTIRDLLGHTSDRMTQRYAHASADHLHAAVESIARGVSPGVSPAVAEARDATLKSG